MRFVIFIRGVRMFALAIISMLVLILALPPAKPDLADRCSLLWFRRRSLNVEGVGIGNIGGLARRADSGETDEALEAGGDSIDCRLRQAE